MDKDSLPHGHPGEVGSSHYYAARRTYSSTSGCITDLTKLITLPTLSDIVFLTFAFIFFEPVFTMN